MIVGPWNTCEVQDELNKKYGISTYFVQDYSVRLILRPWQPDFLETNIAELSSKEITKSELVQHEDVDLARSRDWSIVNAVVRDRQGVRRAGACDQCAEAGDPDSPRAERCLHRDVPHLRPTARRSIPSPRGACMPNTVGPQPRPRSFRIDMQISRQYQVFNYFNDLLFVANRALSTLPTLFRVANPAGETSAE